MRKKDLSEDEKHDRCNVVQMIKLSKDLWVI